MVATTVETRNFWLDAFGGHPENAYSFNPLTSPSMNLLLCNGGAPGDPGAYALPGQSLGQLVLRPVVSDESVYPDSVDGATKVYTGEPVVFPIVEEDMDDATHLLIYWNIFAWLFEFDEPIQMLSGRAVQVTLPDITIDPEGTTTIGMTDALRMRFLGELFGNSESPMGPGPYFDLALYIGDPLEGGVEVSAWDYTPLRTNNTIWFTSASVETQDPYMVYFRPSVTVRFVRAFTDWGHVTHWGWKNTAATPVLLHSAPFDDDGFDVPAGTLVEIDPDALTMTFGSPSL